MATGPAVAPFSITPAMVAGRAVVNPAPGVVFASYAFCEAKCTAVALVAVVTLNLTAPVPIVGPFTDSCKVDGPTVKYESSHTNA